MELNYQRDLETHERSFGASLYGTVPIMPLSQGAGTRRTSGLFRPDHASVRWVWNFEQGAWVRGKVRLTGKILRKDGTVGFRFGGSTVDLSELMADPTWGELTTAIRLAAPTTRVVA